MTFVEQFVLFLLLTARAGGSDKAGAFSLVLTRPAVDPVYGVSLESTVPAIDLALQYVSNATSLIPNLTPSYNQTQVLEVTIKIDSHLRHLVVIWASNSVYNWPGFQLEAMAMHRLLIVNKAFMC